MRLSTDLIVACEIYRMTVVNGERVWFTKLVETLKDKMSKNVVSHAMDTLCDWMLIYGEYGETENGRAGRLFLIDDDHKHRIKDLYDKAQEGFYENYS